MGASRTPIYKSLFVQVVFALVLGIVLGVAAPEFSVGLKILSDAFLKLISMIVAPIVFCVVVHGIAGAGDLKKVGRVGVKALVYFEVMTAVALLLGIALAFAFGPGHGMNIDPATLDGKALSSTAENVHKLQGAGIGSFVLNIVPTTSFDALARNDVLQVLFFAVLFGGALALVGEKGEKITSLVEALSTVLFRMMGLIVRVAPLGVLGAVAYTVGRYGVGSLEQLLSLVALFYMSVAIFVFLVLGTVMRLAGISILKFLSYMREELTIVLATASSDAVLPQIMRKLERMGVKDSVVGLVIPTGYPAGRNGCYRHTERHSQMITWTARVGGCEARPHGDGGADGAPIRKNAWAKGSAMELFPRSGIVASPSAEHFVDGWHRQIPGPHGPHEDNTMRISSGLRTAAIALAALVVTSVSAFADSGSIHIRIVKAGFVIGGSGGSGTLTFHGRRYPLSVGGLSYGFTFGASETNFYGRVTNIRRPSDVAGVYGQAGAGAALGRAGAQGVVLTNQNGAVLSLSGHQVGAIVSADLSGLALSMR